MKDCIDLEWSHPNSKHPLFSSRYISERPYYTTIYHIRLILVGHVYIIYQIAKSLLDLNSRTSPFVSIKGQNPYGCLSAVKLSISIKMRCNWPFYDPFRFYNTLYIFCAARNVIKRTRLNKNLGVLKHNPYWRYTMVVIVISSIKVTATECMWHFNILLPCSKMH